MGFQDALDVTVILSMFIVFNCGNIGIKEDGKTVRGLRNRNGKLNFRGVKLN